jgi:hypothetical protein
MAVAKRRVRVKSFDEQLAEMPLEYLICMDIGHAWNPATLEVAYGDFQVGLTCAGNGKTRQGCGMERDRWRGPDGRLRNRYWHPNGDFGFKHIGRRTPEQRDAIRAAWQGLMEPGLPDERKETA